MLVFRHPPENISRPQMPADVVIVGGGPAGMACALRLSQLIDGHKQPVQLRARNPVLCLIEGIAEGTEVTLSS